LPVDPEDFIQQADSDLPAAFEDLISRNYDERSFDEPTWDDALAVLRRVAELRPDLGVGIWRIVVARDDLAGRADDLRRSVLGGWELADLSSESDTIVALVASEIPVPESVRSISQFLLAQIRKRVDADESPTIEAMRGLVRNLWAANKATFTHGPESSPASLALNSWPGEVASFWVVEVDRRWRHNRDSWAGLNAEESEALTDLLHGPAPTLDAVRPALASWTYFLFNADPTFARVHLLPLFNDEASAAQMWGSYLYNARVDDRMLAAGLLDAMVVEWAHLDSIGDGALRQQFFRLVASVVSFAGVTGRDRQRLLDVSVLAQGGEHAVWFARSVLQFLQSEDVDGAAIWDLWLRGHISARLAGLPRNAAPRELERWADTVPFLGDRIPDAIELFHDQGVGLGEEYRPPTFPDGALIAYGPALVAHLAERVRSSTPTGSTLPHALGELIGRVRAILGDSVQPILDAARDRGFTNIQ